ncbi:skp1-protein-hydroxyproline N-acetylglucosaminyltransferase-like [Mytilus californianus]|uniref:skp1-protein-hydroxyproline N-acetylglucosaminyltransferase-like n=1 Tax=Mytilus californianus TaxID=6549 RepID=UPI002245BA65|nr:skp1-protein-hydroxyproline N-acetylglucosaminyltransferase-like [Mytilus californianus]
MNRRKQLIMRGEVIFSCLLLTVYGMAIQKRNADFEEIYGRNNDFEIEKRYDLSDIRISNRRKRWSIGSVNKGDHNCTSGNRNIDKNKITNEIGEGNFERSEVKSDWSIGSNNEGNKNTANGNKSICNNQNHNFKNTNVFKAGNVGNNRRKRRWSKRKPARGKKRG